MGKKPKFKNEEVRVTPEYIDNLPCLWPPDKVAAFFGISIRTLYNGTKRNAPKPFPVPPIRVGRMLRWDPNAIMAYVKGGAV